MPDSALASQWTDDFLDEMRQQTDPFADKAAAALFEALNPKKHPGAWKSFVKKFVSQDFSQEINDDDFDFDFPQGLKDYFQDVSHFHFTDKELEILEKGADFFMEHGPGATLALAVRSLLKQYAHTKAIQVLRITQLLEDHVNRRIMETMQFVMDVMEPGWHIDERHDDKDRIVNRVHVGIQSIQKLRLVHSMVRFRIKHHLYNVAEEGPWNQKWGEPINQEDMIFAIHTFSNEVILGLIESGKNLDHADIENYYQTWALIGRALGVDQRLQPKNFEEGLALQKKIYERNFTLPNKAGPSLSRALTNWLETVLSPLGEDVVMAIIKKYNGPENFALLKRNLGLDLDLDKGDFTAHIHGSGLEHQKDRPEGIDDHGWALEILYDNFMRSLLKTERGGKNSHFRIGDGFGSKWNLNRDDEEPPTGLEKVWITLKALVKTIIDWIINLFK